MPLTDAAIRAARPAAKSRKLFDSEGLYLEISPAGGKWWRLKYRWAGLEKRLSLGTYPDVSLLEARRRRDDARRTLAGGVDPSAQRRSQKMAADAAASNTFEAVARAWHTSWQRTRTEKHAAQVLRRLEADVFPRIGAMPVASVRALDLVQVAKAVGRSRFHRRGRIPSVFVRWCSFFKRPNQFLEQFCVHVFLRVQNRRDLFVKARWFCALGRDRRAPRALQASPG